MNRDNRANNDILYTYILYLMRFVSGRGLSGRIEKQKEREGRKEEKDFYAKEVRPKNQWCNSNLLLHTDIYIRKTSCVGSIWSYYT